MFTAVCGYDENEEVVVCDGEGRFTTDATTMKFLQVSRPSALSINTKVS